ncbi:hypothetical protein L209DRAFT_758504 [Thermothelomyces heterothallicus CBS 203.75]
MEQRQDGSHKKTRAEVLQRVAVYYVQVLDACLRRGRGSSSRTNPIKVFFFVSSLLPLSFHPSSALPHQSLHVRIPTAILKVQLLAGNCGVAFASHSISGSMYGALRVCLCRPVHNDKSNNHICIASTNKGIWAMDGRSGTVERLGSWLLLAVTVPFSIGLAPAHNFDKYLISACHPSGLDSNQYHAGENFAFLRNPFAHKLPAKTLDAFRGMRSAGLSFYPSFSARIGQVSLSGAKASVRVPR